MTGLHLRRGILPILRKVIRAETDGWWAEALATVAIPLSFYLAFGLGLRNHITEVAGEPYMVFMAPGLISLTILLEAYRTGAWGLWLDRWHTRMIHEFRIKPITTSDIIVGEILGGFLMALVKGVLVAMVLFLLSAYATSPWNVAVYLLYLFPGSILFTCVGAMVGTAFRKPDQIAQSQTIVVTPLLYLGGLFFPLSAFPSWVREIIAYLPTTALFDGGRKAFLYGQVDGFYLTTLALAALLSFVLATVLFNRQLSQ